MYALDISGVGTITCRAFDSVLAVIDLLKSVLAEGVSTLEN
jgi:hypothetical protein